MSKLSVRNVKVIASLSEETTCFSSSVYWEGRKIGTASNRGRGGETDVYISDAETASTVAAWVKANPTQSECFGTTFVHDNIPDYVDQLIADWRHLEDMKKLTRKKILYVEDGKLWATVPRAPAGVPTATAFAANIKALKGRRPNIQVLNDLPEGEALALYLKYGVN